MLPPILGIAGLFDKTRSSSGRAQRWFGPPCYVGYYSFPENGTLPAWHGSNCIHVEHTHRRTLAVAGGREGPPEQAAARSTDLRHRSLQLPLPVLHAGRALRRAPPVPAARELADAPRRSSASRGSFVQLGVRKLRLTGGEPLLRARHRRPRRAASPRSAGVEDLALTTNGSLPRRARRRSSRRAGLTRLTVSLDSLDPAVFKEHERRPRRRSTACSPASPRRGAPGSRRSRSTASSQRGMNDHTLVDLVERFRGTGTIVRFIEYMDVGTLNGWEPAQVVPLDGDLARIAARWPLEPVDRELPRRGRRALRVQGRAGRDRLHLVRDAPFCGDCIARALSADGALVYVPVREHGHRPARPLRAGASDADLVGCCRTSGAIAPTATASSAASCSSTSPRKARRPSASRCTGWAADAHARRRREPADDGRRRRQSGYDAHRCRARRRRVPGGRRARAGTRRCAPRRVPCSTRRSSRA